MPKRKTHEEFLEQVKDRPFTVLGRYESCKKKMRFRCHKCNREWLAKPNCILASGTGCPYCVPIGIRKENVITAEHRRWVEIDISSPKHPKAIMLVDKADWEYLLSIKTGRVTMGCNGYPQVKITGYVALIHNILLSDAKQVDHINGVRYDNRRSNLRACTASQNAMNKGMLSNNTSGVTGVYWHKRAGKWCAHIKVDYKKIYLGLFDDLSAAAAARKAAEVQYFGEFRRKS